MGAKPAFKRHSILAGCLAILVILSATHPASSANGSTRQLGNTVWTRSGDELTVTFGSTQVSGSQRSGRRTRIRTTRPNRVTRLSDFYSISFDEPEFAQNGDYESIVMPGLESWCGEPGTPVLPMETLWLLIPYGVEVTEVKVILGTRYEVSGEHYIEPAQEAVPISMPELAEETLPDVAIYDSDEIFPLTPGGSLLRQTKRGYSIMILNLHPVEYMPESRRVFYYTGMDIEIVTKEAQASSVSGSSASAVKLPLDLSDFAGEEIRDIVDNPDIADSYDKAPDDAVMGSSNIHGLADNYEYVIITTTALRGATGEYTFQDLVDSKIADGMTAGIFTLEGDIYPNYSGADNQAKIRNFIKDFYQNRGTRYVLLGGSNVQVPCRKFYVAAGPNPTYRYIPADLYYGCLDGDANADGDSRYGEYPEDDPDMLGEVYVGRAPVETVDDVSNFVRKTLWYKGGGHSDPRKVTMLGEKLDYTTYGKPYMLELVNGASTHGATTVGFMNSDYADSVDIEELYDYDSTWSSTDFINKANGGVHVFNHLGHANITYTMKTYNSQLTGLNNTDYFFAYSQGCLPGAFDYSDCFAEEVTTMEEGAFAVIMNTRYGWYRRNSTDGPSQRFHRTFWDAYLDKGHTRIGRAHQDSKEANLGNLDSSAMIWCYYTSVLFGDPELSLAFEGGNRRGANISSPTEGQFISDAGVDILGTAYVENDFVEYRLFYADAADPDNRTLITRSTSTVQDGLLARWDTSMLADKAYVITLEVEGGGQVNTDTVSVTIDTTNDPPEFVGLTDKRGVEGERVAFWVEATDPDDPSLPSGQLTYSVDSIWREYFDTETGAFSWTPGSSHDGNHYITFTVQDGLFNGVQNTVTKTICISVWTLPWPNMVALTQAVECQPNISGNMTLWEELENTRLYKIYMRMVDPPNSVYGDKIPVSDTPGNQRWPVVDRGTVAWGQQRGGNYEIVFANYDPESGEFVDETFVTETAGNEWLPEIHDDKIVWVDDGQKTIEMAVVSFATAEVVARATVADYHIPISEIKPTIHTDNVVWHDKLPGQSDTELFYRQCFSDGTMGPIIQLTDDEYNQVEPHVYGYNLVWIDDRHGENRDVYLGELNPQTGLGREWRVTSEAAKVEVRPRISDDIIVWTDARERVGSYPLNDSIFAREYGLITGPEGPEIRATTHAATEQYPRISGNRVIYQQWNDLDYSWNIFMIIVELNDDRNSSPRINEMTVSPNPARTGQNVTFTGSATDADGDDITYSWTSSLAGALSSEPTFTTNSLPRGGQFITFKVEDGNGGRAEQSIWMVVGDFINSPPEIDSMTISPDRARAGEIVTFAGHATDSDEDDIVYDWLSSRDGFLTHDATFERSSLSVGVHEITLVAQDNRGGRDEETRSLTIEDVEGTPPTLAITTPADGATVSPDGFDFRGTANDASGIDKVWVEINNGSTRTSTYANCYYWEPDGEWKWDFRFRSDHIRDASSAVLTARAYDENGNTTDLQIGVSFDSGDTTPPELTITSPADGAVVPPVGFPLTMTIDDESDIKEAAVTLECGTIEINGTASYWEDRDKWIYFGIDYFDLLEASGQTALITVRATDANDNFTEQRINVTVGPLLDLSIVSPVNGAEAALNTNNGAPLGFDLLVRTNDVEYGIDKILVTVIDLSDGSITVRTAPMDSPGSDGLWKYRVLKRTSPTTGHVTPGHQAELIVQVYDMYGNAYRGYYRASATVNVVSEEVPDTTPPELNITFPADNSNVDIGGDPAGFDFNMQASDSGSGIRNLHIYVYDSNPDVNDFTVRNATPIHQGGSSWTYRVLEGNVSSGYKAWLFVSAYDNSNNWTGWKDVEVTVGGGGDGDTEPPTLTITSPAGNAEVYPDEFVVRGTADDNAGIDRVTLSIDDRSSPGSNVREATVVYDSQEKKTWHADIPESWVTPGHSARIQAKAYDASGNDSPATLRDVRIIERPDDPPSGVTITYPAEGASARLVNGSFEFTGTAFHASGVASVKIAIYDFKTGRFSEPDGTANFSNGTWSYTVDAMSPDGSTGHVNAGHKAALCVGAIYGDGTFSGWEIPGSQGPDYPYTDIVE